MGIRKVKVSAFIGLMISGMAQGHPPEREVHELTVEENVGCFHHCEELKEEALERAAFFCHRIDHGEVSEPINRCESYYSYHHGSSCVATIEFFCE